MNSSIKSISELLNNASGLSSVGFSQGYSYDAVNADEYFEELLENSTQESPIFSGIIILEKTNKRYTIIDGLQRITTICLLLIALCENYKNTTKKNEEARKKVFKRYLVNSTKKPKLNLGTKEQEIYLKILFGKELSTEEMKNNLYQVYTMFLEKIKQHRISGTHLFKIISRIRFMIVLTDKSEISTRELYEVLNANKNKSQINLIADFLSEKDIYAASLWQKTMNEYKSLSMNSFLENFIKDFLTVQSEGQVPKENALFNKFKSYYNTICKYKTPSEIVESMVKYSKYYLKIIKADFEEEEIKEQIVILNSNKGQDAYSYLMEVLDDYNNGLINLGVLLDILNMINSILVKRSEDGARSIEIDFANLSKELNRMLIMPDYTAQMIDESKLTINDINKLSTK